MIAVDYKQCQAEKSNGVSFMTFGGRHEMVRCRAVPVTIAIEKKAGADGQVGAMSLCGECWRAFLKQMGEDYAKFEPLEGCLQ